MSNCEYRPNQDGFPLHVGHQQGRPLYAFQSDHKPTCSVPPSPRPSEDHSYNPKSIGRTLKNVALVTTDWRGYQDVSGNLGTPLSAQALGSSRDYYNQAHDNYESRHNGCPAYDCMHSHVALPRLPPYFLLNRRVPASRSSFSAFCASGRPHRTQIDAVGRRLIRVN